VTIIVQLLLYLLSRTSFVILHVSSNNFTSFFFAMVIQVFVHTRTLYQKMHEESFIINRNTILHVSTLLGHLRGELFSYRYTKVALYS
jgi:hypothetical protein